MKYRYEPISANIDPETGFAQQSGWVVVYRWNELGEFIGCDYDWVSKDTGIAAQCTLEAPMVLEDDEGKAIVRNNSGWVVVPDYRGIQIYSKADGSEQTVQTFGEIPDEFTFIAPATPYDKWDGEKWVTDEEAMVNDLINYNQSVVDKLTAEANGEIEIIKDAIELSDDDELKKEYTELLNLWKQYRIDLRSIDLTVENPNYPLVPKTF